MDAEKIRALRLADPFRPFRLLLKDGRQFNVLKAVAAELFEGDGRAFEKLGRAVVAGEEEARG